MVPDMLMFGRPKRREVMVLQLTAMIDIFAMIIIFLIKGTYFGATDIPVLPGMKVPKSFSKENLETAPRLQITSKQVSVSFMGETWPVEMFDPRNRGDARISELKTKLKAFLAGLPAQAKSGGVLLSVVADRDLPYKLLFDTVRVFRESGFETLMFVATGPEERS